MAIRKRTPANGGTKATKVTKSVSKKRPVEDDDEEEYESMKEAKPENEKADIFKLDDKKQKKRIGFPLSTPKGDVAMVKVHYFKAKFQTTLADGKWHAFQAPKNNPELLKACQNHPNLDEKTERATIVIAYDTDSKGNVYGKGKDIGYELLAMKINNPKLMELQEIDEDDDLTATDITVRLDAGKDVKFQDMRFKSAGDALWTNIDLEGIVEEAKELSKKLREVIAYEYTDEKIEALIGDGDDDDEDEDDYENDDDYEDEDIEGDEEDEEEEEAPKKRTSKKSAPAKVEKTATRRRR